MIMTQEPTRHSLGSIGAIPPGEGREFLVEGRKIAVFRTRRGDVYAVDAVCPHRGGPLADGLVGDGHVICPLHAWKFDLRSGTTPQGDCALRTYPVHVAANGDIAVSIETAE